MNKVYEFLLKEIKIKENDTFIIGLSGGPDSMALLNIMQDIGKTININIICAHVNHNTGRAGQIDDQLFVEQYCKKNNLKLEILTIKEYGDDNFHNEARSKRYDYFDKLIKKYHAAYLLTAHHGDDLVETILMRITRGSTLKGYSGFSKVVKLKNCTILRPLIDITKDEIIEYNNQNKIEYVIDTSNDKEVYTRNRFRKHILPFLKKEDKNIHLKFYKFSKIINDYSEYIDREVNKIMSNIYLNNVLNIIEYQSLDKIIKKRVLQIILEQLYEDDLMLITDEHIELIDKLINSKKVNSYIILPNNIKVLKEYNNLTFILKEVEYNTYELEIVDYLELPNGKNIKMIDKTTENSNYICRLDTNQVKPPLYVRTRKNGDKISVKGMNGSKKINDIFINSKIPFTQRDLWPVVVDSNDTIIWLPGLKKSKYDKQINEKYDIILKYY